MGGLFIGDTLYLFESSINDVQQWVCNQLPHNYQDWTEEGSALRQELDAKESCELTYSKANFDALSARFNHIHIAAGQPRNDYGQTVTLDRVADIDGVIPNYEWGQKSGFEKLRSLKYVSTSMFFEHREDARSGVHDIMVFSRIDCADPDVTEPHGWNVLGEAMHICRGLSEITMRLDSFIIRWTGDLIQIDIVSRPDSFKKPPFAMYV